MKIRSLFGDGIRGKSPVVTVQRRLNCYYEVREDGDKSKVVVYGTPGLVPFIQPSTPLNSPVRALLGTQNNLYIVAYNQFQSVASDGTAIFSASIGTNAGNASIAFNPTQVAVVDGSAGYLYTTGSFVTIGGAFPNGAKTITQASGFFVAPQPSTQQFWVSNFNDGATWGALAFASASSYSDNILAVDNLAGNLLIFSEQHMEFWQNSGLTPQPFTPILSAANEFGIAAIFSRAHVDQTIIFLAQTREGQAQIVQVTGFNAQVVSTTDLDYIISQLPTVSDAVGMAYELGKHKFYQITFPIANRSFLFDCSTRLWSETQTGASIVPSRHWGNLSSYYSGGLVVTDYATNQIYKFSDTTYTDNGQTIVREITTRHLLSEFNRIRVSLLYLDMETGVGLQTGQGSNPQIMLQYSKDNGRTWSAERWVSSGMVGQYLTRVLWRRFGSTRDATFKIRMTDPVKFVITEGAMKTNERAGQ